MALQQLPASCQDGVTDLYDSYVKAAALCRGLFFVVGPDRIRRRIACMDRIKCEKK